MRVIIPIFLLLVLSLSGAYATDNADVLDGALAEMDQILVDHGLKDGKGEGRAIASQEEPQMSLDDAWDSAEDVMDDTETTANEIKPYKLVLPDMNSIE